MSLKNYGSDSMFCEYHVSVKAGLIRESEILMLHTGKLRELPGGRIEIGETPTSALTRELREELPGVANFEIGELVGWHLLEDYEHEGISLIVIIFESHATLPSPLKLSDEHKLAQWLPTDEAKQSLCDFHIQWISDLRTPGSG